MDHTEQTVKNALESAGLPYRPCGINADWSVRAYHVGPGTTPNDNTTPQLYVIDTEYGGDAYALVSRTDDYSVPDYILTIKSGRLSIVVAAVQHWL